MKVLEIPHILNIFMENIYDEKIENVITHEINKNIMVNSVLL